MSFTMLLYIKICLFIISNIGFYECIRRKVSINVNYAPSIAIAVQVFFLYIGGLLNVLNEMTYLIYFLGVVMFIYWAYKDRSISYIRNYIKTSYIVFGVAIIMVSVYTSGKVYTHYDNYSHWAAVVKRMLLTNRMPNFEDTIIAYKEYPLGSSLFVYYFSKMVNNSESTQMLAQTVFMLACILPIFNGFEDNKRKIEYIIKNLCLISLINYFFVYNISITNLLVDTLLPLVGACALMFVIEYKDKLINIEFLFVVIIYITQILQIKNSGVFFAILIIVFCVREFINKKKYIQSIIVISIPSVMSYIWKAHCKYVFGENANSKHAVSLSSYLSITKLKSVDDIKTICYGMLKHACLYKDTICLFVIICIVGALIFTLYRNSVLSYMRLIGKILLIYVLYEIGLLAMYIFSMPGEEATSLASCTRYTKTILIFIMYFMIVYIMRLITQNNLSQKSNVLFAIVCFIIINASVFVSFGEMRCALVYKDAIYSHERKYIENAKNEYGIPEGDSYCILIQGYDAGYAYYLGEYIFQSDKIETYLIGDNKDLLNKITSNYVVIWDYDNEVINNWVMENYPEQVGKKIIFIGEK